MKRLTLVSATLVAALDAAAAPYEYSTPVPRGIAAPKELPTRFGTLKLFDRVPDPAGTQKICDNADFQRAVQGYLLGLPAVNQLANRTNMLKMGPANTTVPYWEDLIDSRTIKLTATNNPPYTWLWLDLRQRLLVLEVPPKVLGLIDDMWYRWNTDLGITGPDKGAGGKYLLLPSGYKDPAPDAYLVVRSPTFRTWAGWRSFLVDGDPKQGVAAVKQHTKIYPLAQPGSPPPELSFVNMSGKPFNRVAPVDESFRPMLHQVVPEEPTDSIDATTLGILASVGIEKGKPFAPDARMKRILAEAAALGSA